MVKVYVTSHINKPMPRFPYLVPLQTGSVAKEPWDGFLRDDQGDNISHKNRFFGELTGLYWIWKNTTDDEVGLCHYRRFFSPILFPHSKSVGVDLGISRRILEFDPLGKIFEMETNLCDLIVPSRISAASTFHYTNSHRPADWEAMLNGLEEFYPGQGVAAREFFEVENPLHWWCMFICKRKTLNEYCEWLFPLLFHLEGKICPAEDDYYSRVYAFLTEHLFNFWTAAQEKKTINRPVLLIEPSD